MLPARLSSLSSFSLLSCWLLSQASCEAQQPWGLPSQDKIGATVPCLPPPRERREHLSHSCPHSPVGHLTGWVSATDLLCSDFWPRSWGVFGLKFGLCGASCRPHGMRVMEGKSLNMDQKLWLKERRVLRGKKQMSTTLREIAYWMTGS